MLQKRLTLLLLVLILLPSLVFGGLAFYYARESILAEASGLSTTSIEPTISYAKLQTLEIQFLLVTGLLGVLAVFAAGKLARRIVNPIVRLTETALLISNGDQSIRANVVGDDEFSALANSFNRMTDALAIAQHNLEAEVAKRIQEVRISEERYMLAERAVNDGIWDWNILSHEYYLSPRWNKILGYAEDELPHVESIFFELIHPDDKAKASEAFRRHLEYNERYFTELRLRCKDGSYRWVLDRGEASRDADGKPVRMVGSIADITERKATEAELRKYREHLEELVTMATTEVKAIVQTAVNGVITIDSSGAIRTFNPAAETLFGWTGEEIIGKNVSLLMPEPDAAAHDAYIQRFLNTHQAKILGIEREVVAKRKDGSCFPANLAVGHAIFSEGRHMFVAFISDISQQKHVEQELRLAKEAAEAAVKAKANFLANMSHEIRTPMNTVIGFAEVALQDQNLSASTRSHVKTILSSGRHLLSVINDILDFSKIEAGKIELEAVCFNLRYAVQETLQTIGLTASEKGLRLDLDMAADLPKHFLGDPNRLRQVLLNLVGNSVKFTETGGIVVTINRAAGEDMLHFAISDTGIGMTPAQTEKVFESFSQADTTTSRRFGGTGLGTTISKQIVELMGGKIWVESQFGVGSTFHFTVHLPESSAAENCLYEINTPMVLNYLSPRRFKVLLAEDIEANAKLACLRLEQQGHQVQWVKNGREAVEAYSQGDFDLILMDLQMPILDGLDATREIRQLEAGKQHIPILALTASVLSDERQQSIAAGMDAVVGKPINFDELLTQMENLVAQGRGVLKDAVQVIVPQLTVINIDFSPLEGVADWRQGLATWQVPLVYAEALTNFVEQHADDAAKLEQLLLKEPAQLAEVRRMAHALKGVAGNLSLPDIAAIATEMESTLKVGNRENIAQLCHQMDVVLQAARVAVLSLKLPVQQTMESNIAFDVDVVGKLLQELLVALGALNPETVEPILQKLAPYLIEADLKAISREVDSFDFDRAKVVVGGLAGKLGC